MSAHDPHRPVPRGKLGFAADHLRGEARAIVVVRTRVIRAILLLATLWASGCDRPQTGAPADFPAAGLPNAHGLVSASWVRRLLDHGESPATVARPATYSGARFVVMEASWGPLERAEAYLAGHLPGAFHLNTDDFETGYPEWRLRSLPELQETIGRHGIAADTTVIVYGEQLIAVARVWWVLKYAGVADVRIMDGGLRAWQAANYPIATDVARSRPVPFDAPSRPEFLATTAQVRAGLERGDVWIADVRSAAEFAGRASGYRYLDAKGRIPSSIHLDDADDGARRYVQRNGCLLPPAEVLQSWQQSGLLLHDDGRRFQREVIFTCGGGWRSSVAFFYAWLLGCENIRNYSDGWCGWSTEYRMDPHAEGSTPGWRQQPTGNPFERD